MNQLSGLVGAPKYIALASTGVACLGMLLVEDNFPDTSSLSSYLVNTVSKYGIVASTGMVAYNAAWTVFNRHSVVDALRSRPHDSVKVMRAAGGRAGACTAASLLRWTASL